MRDYVSYMAAAVAVWLGGPLGGGTPAFAVEISNVEAPAVAFDPLQNERAPVTFRISHASEVELEVFDARGRVVRTVRAAGPLERGAHTLAWDGRDETGRPAPPNVYVYTLTARAGDGSVARWDPPAPSSGLRVSASEVEWRPTERAVHYRLDRPARVTLRIGLRHSGCVLRTLVDGVPRSAGEQLETWDGLDASGTFDFFRHPEVRVEVEAYALAENSVIVGPPRSRPAWISDLPGAASGTPAAATRSGVAAAGDLPAELSLPADVERRDDGVAVVRSRTRLRVEVPGGARALGRRGFSLTSFVDGELIAGGQHPMLPASVELDPRHLPDGIHYLTLNLRAPDGRLAHGTVPVVIARELEP